MDYCDPCRRHLNGALACPGCGTSADALRWREPEYGGYEAVPEGPEGVHDDSDGSDGPDGPDSEHEDDGEPSGRAARRRGRGHGPVADGPGGGTSRRDRKAAAHRRRRRRTLFVAAGFVLAAGGL
ncbi:SCO2400 family protein, partial [Streptomyces coeruleorubidus]